MSPPHREATSRLNVATAAELLDFRGGGISPISEHAAHEQLKGAVALHNMLLDNQVAYLADEVGMGKTYVALGTLALLRHFDPDFRVLVIAPRENIQKKWIKELKNFTQRNVRFSDQRVRGISGAPAKPTVVCNSLLELVRETVIDADRDFFTRLTSFSLPLTDNIEGWRAKRDEIREHVQWLEPELFDLRNKEAFKDNFARAVNCALPHFDLVIFDEGHNLKGGFRKTSASRNRMLALAFGHPAERQRALDAGFSGFGARAKRVLFLSATPLENDYSQLWNQLDVFGHASAAAILNNRSATDEEKRNTATTIMIRRVTSLPVAGKELTKNQYRREWRSGGVSIHDDPLQIPNDKQKLVVALIQKKVSELLGAKFNNRFQIGMLASFESFLETAGIRKKPADDEPGVFDDPDQTDDPLQRTGIDVGSVNHLARSYRNRFGSELPHPKMDAVVARLSSSFLTGEKSLVFVRRVASVIELQRKLEEAYDDHLFTRLRLGLEPAVKKQFEAVVAQYLEERKHTSRARHSRDQTGLPDDDESVVEPVVDDDAGGKETFFAWFFRGEGPPGILSGATLQRRFSQAGSVYSTFFEDNHVSWLLGVTPNEEHRPVAAALAKYLDLPLSTLGETLDRRAQLRLPRVKKQQRRNLFVAYQEAALTLISEHPGELAEKARIVLEERYALGETVLHGASRFPKLETWLDLPTFWTGIRERPPLRQALWPDSQPGDFRSTFREQELR